MLFKLCKKITISVFVIYTILSFTIITNAKEYEWSVVNTSASTETNSLSESENTENTTQDSLNLDCESAILIEQNSGQVLYEKNAHEQLRPASVTKLMSILLILEALESGQITIEDKVPCSENAASMGGSQIWLDTKETLTVNEMLKAICIVSANDCVVAMAEYISGSEEAFVQKMNERAKQLGMNDTCFKNCHGIDEDGHVTSSYDIALMSKELLNNHPDITNYTTVYMDTLRDGKSELVNTNKLIRNYNGATGLKTGSTSIALYNLSASATRDNLSLIAVVMKAPTSDLRFKNAKTLLDYGFKYYTYKQFANKGETVGKVAINKGIIKNINAVVSSNAGVVVRKEEENKIVQNMSLEENVQAPIKQGQKLGEIIFSIDGKTVAIVDIVSEKNVEKETFGQIVKYVFSQWFNMFPD
jgi:D-alanyl-D-alanine carboxypeptidase (penicillin-binding protein 5/6)